MNKQEAIEKIKSKKITYNCLSNYGIGYNEALDVAIHTINQINAPEKPVLTKEEAEWVDKLNESFNLPDALYYITRLGYGYLLNFEMCGKTYELPFDSHATYGEMRKLKERLVNAVLYGYEVRKEKLYKVFLKRTGAQLGVCVPHGEDKTQFTKVELQEYDFDNLDVYEVEEVEE